MNTKITFSEWSEQIHQDMPTISNWKKRYGKDSTFPFPEVVGNYGRVQFYVKEELDNWYAVFQANYPLQRHLFVNSADREVVRATRRLVELRDISDRVNKEIKVLEDLLENKTQGEQK
jgi:hypothetical protein